MVKGIREIMAGMFYKGQRIEAVEQLPGGIVIKTRDKPPEYIQGEKSTIYIEGSKDESK